MNSPRHNRAGRISGNAFIAGRVNARVEQRRGERKKMQRAIARQMPKAGYGEKAKLFEVLA